VNKEEAERALQDEAEDDNLIVSDSLRDQLDLSTFGGQREGLWQFSGITCTVYFETPSVGITGRLIGLERSKKGAKVDLEIDPQGLGEALSCPEFIRVVVSTDEKVLYEADFVEPWEEVSRRVEQRNDGRVELHISLAEHDS